MWMSKDRKTPREIELEKALERVVQLNALREIGFGGGTSSEECTGGVCSDHSRLTSELELARKELDRLEKRDEKLEKKIVKLGDQINKLGVKIAAFTGGLFVLSMMAQILAKLLFPGR